MFLILKRVLHNYSSTTILIHGVSLTMPGICSLRLSSHFNDASLAISLECFLQKAHQFSHPVHADSHDRHDLVHSKWCPPTF